MRYFGGKSRIAGKLAPYIQNEVDRLGKYWEPFVGAAWVLRRIDAQVKVASDANAALITLWRAVQSGWQPPETLSERAYKLLKELQDPDNPLTAFAGFGCSFAGKWFGGYASSGARNYAGNARNTLLKAAPLIQGVHFQHARFSSGGEIEGTVTYCDPPYQGTTGYGAVGPFDSDRFWNDCRVLARRNVVLVSEYAAPEGVDCVMEIHTRTDIRDKSGGMSPRIEKLFRVNP